MPIPNAIPPVASGMPAQVAPIETPPPNPENLSVSDQYDLAVNSRDPDKLWKMAVALKGTPAQKAWAEKIREEFLLSNETNEEEKSQLVSVGGFTENAKFLLLVF